MSQNIKQVPTSDYLAVIAVIENYITGLRIGDSAQVSKSFHKDAIMYGFSAEGPLLGGPISNLWTFMDTYGPAKDVIAHNDVISMTPTTAVVKVDMENDAAGNSYTDNHTLLKMDGKWIVIAKVFHCYSK